MRYIKSYTNDNAIQAAVDDKSLGKPYVALNDATGEIDWNSKEETPDYASMYLTIEALEDGDFYVRNANVSYSVNGAEWDTTTGETALSLNQGDKVRFKNIITGVKQNSYLFTGNTLQHIAYGNIESLEYGDDFVGETTGKARFSRCFGFSIGLQDVSNLVLPAISGIIKYEELFNGCTNITKSPVLPAPTMDSYQHMFENCSKLSYVKCLLTNPLSLYGQLNFWMSGVANTGTFLKHPDADWSSVTGISGIPRGWTVIEE